VFLPHIFAVIVEIFSTCVLTLFLFIQAAKRHLTQRIEKLDDKLDLQKALSGQIRDDVLSL
jgi:hypothetical protein